MTPKIPVLRCVCMLECGLVKCKEEVVMGTSDR